MALEKILKWMNFIQISGNSVEKETSWNQNQGPKDLKSLSINRDGVETVQFGAIPTVNF